MAKERSVGEADRMVSGSDRDQILREASAGDFVIAEVARRHGMSPDELYRWRYEERQQQSQVVEEDRMGFVPVGIISSSSGETVLRRADIQFSDDVSLTIEGAVSVEKLSRILEVMEGV